MRHFLIAAVCVLAACTGETSVENGRTGPGDAGNATTTPAPLGPGYAYDERIQGLRVSGRAPTITWSPVEGAASYAVLVVPQSHETFPWAWMGSSTSVDYGALDEESAAMLMTPDADEGTENPVRGETYDLIVAAMDANGFTILSSEPMEFACEKPCGAPRSNR